MQSKKMWVASLVLPSLLFLSGGLCANDGKTKRPFRQYTIEQFIATTTVAGASFSPDEKQILVSSNQSGIFNVHVVPVGGSQLVPITKSTTDSTYAVSYFPADSRVLYTRDQGGDENNHLYVLGTDGQERDLTPGEKLKARFAGWARDDKALFVLTNERDPRFFDLYRMDASSYERRLLYKDDAGYELGSISNDEKWIAFGKSKTTSDSDIYLYSIATGEMRHVTPTRMRQITTSPILTQSRAGSTT